MNNNWDTDKFDPAHLTHQVIAIHLWGCINQNNEGDEGNPPTNHWAALLECPDGSIGLDMMPGYGSDGLRGKIEISSKDCVSMDDAIKILSIPVNIHATVQSITDMINDKGRDRYTFTEEEEGCRYWIWNIVSDLEAAKIISTGSGETVWRAVSCYWRYPSGYEPRVVKQGKFY
jgi:hypothetical protein